MFLSTHNFICLHFKSKLTLILNVSAHSSAGKVLFRDLKPSNVGFDVNGTVKLFDLGNCRDLAFSAKTGENLGFAGTPRYMATEVGAGKENGLPSDVCKCRKKILRTFECLKTFANVGPSSHRQLRDSLMGTNNSSYSV